MDDLILAPSQLVSCDGFPNNRRLLIVDACAANHETLRQAFEGGASDGSPGTGFPLASPASSMNRGGYEIDFVFHISEALPLIQRQKDGDAFAAAVIDVATAGNCDLTAMLQELWHADAELQVVLHGTEGHLTCDRSGTGSWIPPSGQLLVFRHRLDPTEVRQLAAMSTRKWDLQRQSQLMAERLNQLVEGRIADIARAHVDLVAFNRKLEAAKAAAEEANQAKSAFLATMSHEIRTPMTAILGYADYLLEEGDLRQAPRERIEAINTIVRNGRHLVQLINDILDLSKIEANRIETERIACQPLAVAMDVVSLIRGRAAEKKLDLTIGIEGQIPETIESDPTRIRQILVNLLGNAIKFTEQGKIELTLRFLGRFPDSYLQFEVRDTGIGMTDSQIRKLFQPFTQVDSSMTRKYGGTGLGLCICKRLSEMLGGDISVESRLNQGSAFRVNVATGSYDEARMLTMDAVANQAKPDAIAEAQSRQVRMQLAGRVLLAEDGPDNQRLLAHVLRKSGCDVTVVENGQIAFECVVQGAAAGSPFDVVLMDMQMPVLDGYAATRRLREHGCNLPIIALTAFAMTGDRERCLASGCTDYLTKPIDRRQLLSTVGQYLEQARSSEPCSSRG